MSVRDFFGEKFEIFFSGTTFLGTFFPGKEIRNFVRKSTIYINPDSYQYLFRRSHIDLLLLENQSRERVMSGVTRPQAPGITQEGYETTGHCWSTTRPSYFGCKSRVRRGMIVSRTSTLRNPLMPFFIIFSRVAFRPRIQEPTRRSTLYFNLYFSSQVSKQESVVP